MVYYLMALKNVSMNDLSSREIHFTTVSFNISLFVYTQAVVYDIFFNLCISLLFYETKIFNSISKPIKHTLNLIPSILLVRLSILIML